MSISLSRSFPCTTPVVQAALLYRKVVRQVEDHGDRTARKVGVRGRLRRDEKIFRLISGDIAPVMLNPMPHQSGRNFDLRLCAIRPGASSCSLPFHVVCAHE